jgi:predicted nucleotidyltransferase
LLKDLPKSIIENNMEVLTKEIILQKVHENKNKIRRFGISRIGLFGSFARGEQRNDSDVDLLVEFYKGEKTFRNFIEFSEYIEKTLGRKVEVLTPESVSPYIAPYIKDEVKYVQI